MLTYEEKPWPLSRLQHFYLRLQSSHITIIRTRRTLRFLCKTVWAKLTTWSQNDTAICQNFIHFNFSFRKYKPLSDDSARSNHEISVWKGWINLKLSFVRLCRWSNLQVKQPFNWRLCDFPINKTASLLESCVKEALRATPSSRLA